MSKSKSKTVQRYLDLHDMMMDARRVYGDNEETDRYIDDLSYEMSCLESDPGLHLRHTLRAALEEHQERRRKVRAA